MMKINSYADLLAEKRSLQSSLALHKEAIKHSIEEVKEKLKPFSNVAAFAEKAVTRDSTNPLITTGVNFAADMVLKNVILARAGWLPKLVLPYVLKNYSSHLFSGNGNGKANHNGNGKGIPVERLMQPRKPNFFHRLGDKLKSA